jgi:YgiT-type zinc finger domain-containing protein
MRCDTCDNGERRSAVRSRLAEKDGHNAIVLGVPVEECTACGHVWLTTETAVRLDELFNQLLLSGAELTQIQWNPAQPA